MARCGQVFKDKAIARLPPPESSNIDQASLWPRRAVLRGLPAAAFGIGARMQGNEHRCH